MGLHKGDIIGVPDENDTLVVVLEGGRRLVLVYKGHNASSEGMWEVQENGEWPAEFRFKRRYGRGSVPASSYRVYVDGSRSLIAVGRPLHLVLIRSGRDTKWVRATTEQLVRSIEVL